MLLPTFATSTVSSDAPTDYVHYNNEDSPCNFDLDDPSTIMLHKYQIKTKNSKKSDDDDDDDLSDLYCLRLKPMRYYVYVPSAANDDYDYEKKNP
ncbi:hypothetical protein BCR42DRAFT_428384 [Absidia repens]|uniref:Uncharacterized protein n=1 Tax=Absidia repens TaxID=90262 RepID=A0A1X2HY81_9FUNG|nr:hypothetical protein BCR42DRAFT_428384 [Absidia repens]